MVDMTNIQDFKTDKKISLKLTKLKEKLLEYRKVVVGFSGGIDSTFLTFIAQKTLGYENVKAITLDFALLSKEDLYQAKKIANKYHFNHEIIDVKVLPETLKKNPIDRCYLCKKENFSFLKKYCKKIGFNEVLDGSNADDDPNERPGSKAIAELNIKTPLKDVGFTKNEIRTSAKFFDLINWNRQASPCLATRFPHNSEILTKELQKIEEAEKYLRKIGFPIVRIRYHNNLCRIEVEPEKIIPLFEKNIRDRVYNKLKKLGFEYITVDIKGYPVKNLK